MSALRWAPLAVIALLCGSCSTLADQATLRLCAKETVRQHHKQFSQCILEHNATVLIAKRDYHDYTERFNLAMAEPSLRAEYQELRKQAERLKTTTQRNEALKQLGSLNQWIEEEEGLEAHPWKSNPPDIRQVVASRP